MIAFIVVSSILTYIIGSGVTYAVGETREWDYAWSAAPWFAVVLWPVVLPALLAVAATRSYIANRNQKSLPEARIHRE